MPKKKQQKSTEKNGKPKGVKKKNASLPRRPGGSKEVMFLSKVDTFLENKLRYDNETI